MRNAAAVAIMMLAALASAPVPAALPDSEAQVIAAIADFEPPYGLLDDDAAALPLIKERYERLQAVNSSCCQGWSGSVLKVEIAESGGIRLLVGIGSTCGLGNFAADIAPASPLYAKVSVLERGSLIRFAGHMVLHPDAGPGSLASHYIDFLFDDVTDVTPRGVGIPDGPRDATKQ